MEHMTGIGVPKISDPIKETKVDTTTVTTIDGSNREKYIDSTGREYLLNKFGDAIYSGTPSTKGQFNNPELWVQEAAEAKYLNLSSDEGLAEYNTIIGKASLLDPEIIIAADERFFHNGQLYTFVCYNKVKYLVITKIEKK